MRITEAILRFVGFASPIRVSGKMIADIVIDRVTISSKRPRCVVSAAIRHLVDLGALDEGRSIGRNREYAKGPTYNYYRRKYLTANAAEELTR